MNDDSFKFLGIPVEFITVTPLQTPHLRTMLNAVDNSRVTRHQKLRLFKHGICPRLSWPFLVENFTITWLERNLQSLATKYLKKWSGLTQSANTAILYLPSKKGGLALPSLVSLDKKQQSILYVQRCWGSSRCSTLLASTEGETEIEVQISSDGG